MKENLSTTPSPIRLLNPKTRWDRIVPFLKTKQCEKMLDRVVRQYARSIAVSNPETLFPNGKNAFVNAKVENFVAKGRQLWWETSSGCVYHCRRPAEYSPRMYTFVRGCHYVAPLYQKFAERAYPEYFWTVFHGVNHSTVGGTKRKNFDAGSFPKKIWWIYGEPRCPEPEVIYDLLGSHFKKSGREIWDWCCEPERNKEAEQEIDQEEKYILTNNQ